MWDRIEQVVLKAQGNGVFSKCVIGVIELGSEPEVKAFGDVKVDSIFDVASVTKVVPTLTLALKLIEEGRLNLDDKLIEYVPAFRNSDRENVLIKHLVTQTLDYDFRLSDFKDRTPDKILDVIFATDFKSPPGETYYYTNATSILLGLVVERIYEDTLDRIAERVIFDPLMMTRTSFHPEHFNVEEIVPTEVDEWRGKEIRGEVHDESAWKLQDKITPGSAGVFSTVPDLLKFMEAVLKGDMGKIALGWEMGREWMGSGGEKRIGKTGFTGSVIMADLEEHKALAILSDYTYPQRKPDLPKGRNEFFREVADVVF